MQAYHSSSTSASPRHEGSSVNSPGTGPATPHEPTLRRFVGRILTADVPCVEVRILDCKLDRGRIVPADQYGCTISGWFDDPEKLIREVERVRGVSVFVTPNPVDPALRARSCNRLTRSKNATTDAHVACLRWWFIDIDAKRPTGISSTEAELAKALAGRDRILADHPDLAAAALWGRSGNGAWVLALLPDYPNDDEHKELIARAVAALKRYDGDGVEIDPAAKNPARVMPLPGTVKCKGDSLPERPHRLVTLDSPDRELVPLDLVAWLARQPTPAEPERAPERAARRSSNGDDEAIRDPTRYAAAAFAAEVDNVASAAENSRNVTLNKSAFVLGQLVGEGLLDEGQVERALADAAKRAGLGEAEVKTTIRSGMTRGKAQARGLKVVEPTSTRNGDGRHRGNGTPGLRPAIAAPTPATVTSESQAGPERPEILVTTAEHETIDAAVEALANEPSVYQRGNVLVTVLRDAARRKKKDLDRPPGSPRIVALPNARLRELLTKNGRWAKWHQDRSGKFQKVPTHPTDWAVAGVAARGEWPDVRPIEGVVEVPTIREDGSILETCGWDESTGLFYEPNCRFSPLPAEPTRDDARQAAESLLALVGDFPFAVLDADGGRAHRAAWLTSLLTCLARFAIDGPVPLFLFDGNTPGTGKSKLCDINATITTGRMMARSSYPDADEEMRKLILSVALAGDRLLLFDNVPTGWSVGGGSLDAALTARTIKGRILGKSEMTADVPLNAVIFATGNNLGLKGDALRRIVPCRLETREERPEERRQFAIKGDILKYVLRERGRLVTLALTILKAHARAGRPEADLTPMDYLAWCSVVRHAVHWATGIDPCKTREGMRANDPETNEATALLECWEALCKAANKTALTSAEALAILKDRPSDHANLREILAGWSKTGELPSPRVIGNRLNKIRGRVYGGRYLDSFAVDRYSHWSVKHAKSDRTRDESKESAESVPLLGAKNWSDNSSTRIGNSEAGKIQQTPQTHPTRRGNSVIYEPDDPFNQLEPD